MSRYKIFHYLVWFYFRSQPSTVAIRLGSQYGGWFIQLRPDLLMGTYIVGGIGEDISFEIELNNEIQRTLNIEPKFVMVDPTEKSAEHISKVLKNNGNSASQKYSKLGKQEVESYNQTNSIKIKFLNKALWNRNGKLSLVAPENPEHVSYSLSGKGRNTTSFPCVDVLKLIENETEIALIKIDIEGSELNVLTRALESKKIPAQVLVEFDFLRNSKLHDWIKFVRLLRKLRKRNYKLTYKSGLNISLYRSIE